MLGSIFKLNKCFRQPHPQRSASDFLSVAAEPSQREAQGEFPWRTETAPQLKKGGHG